MSTPSQIELLAQKFNYRCHYCDNLTVLATRNDSDRPDRATREHVVPRVLGGPNHMDNYILTCDACNNARGEYLFWCECRDCLEIIYDFLYSPEGIKAAFDSIVKRGKIRVNRRAISKNDRRQVWAVHVGSRRDIFDTFEEAVQHANTVVAAEDRDYGYSA